ncbi:MAG: hypothetical protein JWO04_2149 [Gammaproteobacteria bacterium]|nr:hypothetical protein [Gammaproteobacteria bacterium]
MVEPQLIPAGHGAGLRLKRGEQLRAEMDLAIALSSCPASTCNGGAPIKPLAFESLSEECEHNRAKRT